MQQRPRRSTQSLAMPADNATSTGPASNAFPPARIAVMAGGVIWVLAALFTVVVVAVIHYQIIFIGFWLGFIIPIAIAVPLPCAAIFGLYHAHKGWRTEPWMAGVGYLLNVAALLACAAVTWLWTIPHFSYQHG